MPKLDALHSALTERIIGCGIRVHEVFGAGLYEAVYTSCLVMELGDAGLRVEQQRKVPLIYRGKRLNKRLFVDLIVDDTVLIEVKAIEALAPVHNAQVITYLKLTGLPVALLMNFNVPKLKDGTRRLVHPDLYRRAESTDP
jgi:GxxExxY protein